MKTKLPKCSDVIKHLCEQLDTDIDSRKCRQLKRHLERCPNCRSYLNSLKNTIQLYARIPAPRASREVQRRLFTLLNLPH
jgi:predicted anti-sigma-YlaC factor YlaD